MFEEFMLQKEAVRVVFRAEDIPYSHLFEVLDSPTIARAGAVHVGLRLNISQENLV